MKEITRREALKRIFTIILTIPIITFFTKNVLALNFWVNGPGDMIEYNDVKDIVGFNTPTTFFTNFTSAQSAASLVTVSSGQKLRLVAFGANLDGDATVNPSVKIGFGTSSLDKTVAGHPGLRRGSGISDRGTRQDPVAVGTDDQELRTTTTVATGGSIDMFGGYYLEDV